MEQKKIFPYFQPIICAANGRIVGYEALARKREHNGKISSAGELFSSSELSHQALIALDRDVREQALQRFRQMKEPCYLALNISATWLDYLADFEALPTLTMIDRLGIDRRRIVVEITEAKGDLERLVKVVNIYKKNGIKVAIDDFGSGFSQLERVMSFLPDIIKLDMKLFKAAAKGGIASDVVHLLSRLARRTGCRIVCEGVETPDEFFFGLNCGAQYMQGYLFSPAVEAFYDTQHFHDKIVDLRQQFLNKTLVKEQEKIQFICHIKNLISQLKASVETVVELEKVPTSLFANTGLLRFYLCNNNGDQISANYNFAENQWLVDTEKLGFNWSWREYFYQLRALEVTDSCYRVVTSDRYRDFSSEVLCKTLSLRLDDNRILLVDIAADKL